MIWAATAGLLLPADALWRDIDVQTSIWEEYIADLQLLICRAVSFYSPATSTGISIPFPHLTLHAVSRAPLRASSESGAPDGGPCIYCQIDESEALEDSDEMEGETREVIIIPSNPEARECRVNLSLMPPSSSQRVADPLVLLSAHSRQDLRDPVILRRSSPPSSLLLFRHVRWTGPRLDGLR